MREIKLLSDGDIIEFGDVVDFLGSVLKINQWAKIRKSNSLIGKTVKEFKKINPCVRVARPVNKEKQK
jgi:hypothetical protein